MYVGHCMIDFKGHFIKLAKKLDTKDHDNQNDDLWRRKPNLSSLLLFFFFGSDWFYVGSLVFPSFFLFDLLFNILIVHHSHLPSENFMECSLKSIVQWLTNTITIELLPVPCLHELTPKPRERKNPWALWLGTVFQLHTNLAMTPFQPNPKHSLCIVFHLQVLLQCILPEETPIRLKQGRILLVRILLLLLGCKSFFLCSLFFGVCVCVCVSLSLSLSRFLWWSVFISSSSFQFSSCGLCFFCSESARILRGFAFVLRSHKRICFFGVGVLCAFVDLRFGPWRICSLFLLWWRRSCCCSKNKNDAHYYCNLFWGSRRPRPRCIRSAKATSKGTVFCFFFFFFISSSGSAVEQIVLFFVVDKGARKLKMQQQLLFFYYS